ncbi:hypothetical protein Bbelb_279880 [Branchiostoma belcheri]|nr:hypothetical protein Bbelb_279880 [Branchiostoma belcheri]
MRLFVCALLVTIVAVAMLVDDAQSWRRRAVARLDQVYEADDTAQELREVVEETGDILDLLEEKQEQLLEELQENPEEEDCKKSHFLLHFSLQDSCMLFVQSIHE